MEKTAFIFKPTTNSQISDLNKKFAYRLRKHNKELPSGVFEQVLNDNALINEMVTSVRKHVEARSDFIVRIVKINRNFSAKGALKVTGRKVYANNTVVENMPKAERDEIEIILFKVGYPIMDNDLEKEYELLDLNPVDPYSLAAMNAADPTFADEHPNGTHWKDIKNKWCFAAFGKWNGVRSVTVYCDEYHWGKEWWLAGVRKNTLISETANP
jgi:hypothetical protein